MPIWTHSCILTRIPSIEVPADFLAFNVLQKELPTRMLNLTNIEDTVLIDHISDIRKFRIDLLHGS